MVAVEEKQRSFYGGLEHWEACDDARQNAAHEKEHNSRRVSRLVPIYHSK